MPYKNIEDRRKASKRSYQKCKEHHRLYRLKHKRHKRNYDIKYYHLNKNKIDLRHKKWKKDNLKYFREYTNKREKQRKKEDNNYYMRVKLKDLLRKYFLFYLKNPHAKRKQSKYGIDFYAIIEHLKPFPKDLSKYHIDHICPLSSFDLTDPLQIQEAFKPENHQWLLAEDNLKKGSKFD